MGQLDAWRRSAVAAWLGLVVAGATFVLTLRADNPGPEPQGQNWWLVCWLAMAAAYGGAGFALLGWPARRRVALCFVVIGGCALLTAIAIQYRGYVSANGGRPPWPRLADADDWSRPLLAGVFAVVVPWELLPSTVRRRPAVDLLRGAGLAAAAVLAVTGVLDGPDPLERAAAWVIVAVCTTGTSVVGVQWWRTDRRHDDLLPAWLLAGVVVAWLAVVPDLSNIADWRLPGRDVVTPMLFLATVPLLVAGMIIELLRRSPSGRTVHRVVEWTMLAGGIVIVYTALVAGLGQLVGGSGPTWFLVASTGAIALALEPGRRRVRRLTDGLVYGARDDPLSLVQRVVDQVGAGSGPDLLPDLASTLARELRMASVAIDLRVADGWQRVAVSGAPSPHEREVLLRQRDDVVGRLVVGWEDGPALRADDEEALAQLCGPLALAVRWVRLADELRRSNLSVVLAREEERRRLRRDLHDGIGPALTGISLGLRTTVRRIGRADPQLRPTAQLLDQLSDEVDSVVGELRRIVRDLRPTALDQLGLMEAVTEFTRKFDEDLEMHVVLPAEPVALPAAVEVATYRIVTEAVTNVVRHAGAARCWLRITADGAVGIDVVDDGIGTGGTTSGGVGLVAMRERATELGGHLELRAVEPHGTHLHVELPVAM